MVSNRSDGIAARLAAEDMESLSGGLPQPASVEAITLKLGKHDILGV